MTEMIGQLYYYKLLCAKNKNIYLLIKHNKFVLEYLNLINFINVDKIIIIEENKLYYFNKLYVNITSIKTKIMIKNMLDVNKYIVYKQLIEQKYYDKIFLYRTNNKRTFVNINEILDIVKNNGFFVYSPENDCLENQIKIISNCKILICELGAGCCNMFFTNQNNKMIILSFLKGWANKYLFFNNGLLNKNIIVLDGKMINGNEHKCNWTIDPKLLHNELNK